MRIPFSTEDFLRVMVEYNEAVWPMQIVLVALALGAIALAWRESGGRSRYVSVVLGFLWIWMGAVYHWAFFTGINSAAWVFGALFVVEGLLFVYEGTITKRFRVAFVSAGAAARALSAALFAYALVLYPILGRLLGHRYPRSPTFGLPCPTTIFTFAVLVVADSPVLKRLLVVPFLWSLIGFGAAIEFGFYEDVGLLVAGLTATTAIIVREMAGRQRKRDAQT
jgi:hypothetical protein